MTKPPKTPANVGTSVRKRLLKCATESREDYQLLLLRYANERLLYRLSVSPHARSFVLKGAALFTLWTGRAHRPRIRLQPVCRVVSEFDEYDRALLEQRL